MRVMRKAYEIHLKILKKETICKTLIDSNLLVYRELQVRILAWLVTFLNKILNGDAKLESLFERNTNHKSVL